MNIIEKEINYIRDIEPVEILTKDLWRGCFNSRHRRFMRYDVVVNYLAIENHYGKNDIGWNLWNKYHINGKLSVIRHKKILIDVVRAKQEFVKLIDSFEKMGNLTKKYPLIIADIGRIHIREGSHRMACGLYFGCEKLYGRIKNPTKLKNIQRYRGRYSLASETAFIEHGFTSEEIKILTDKKDEIGRKLGII